MVLYIFTVTILNCITVFEAVRPTTVQSGSRSLATQLKSGMNKWRLAFLVFVLVYAVLVSFDVSTSPIQWDEIAHLNNGSLMLLGDYHELNYFYPPLYDFATAGFFNVLGVTVFAGRLVSVTFSLLSLWVVFELAYRIYDGKTALAASILLGMFPGYFWLSRMAMIETMLVFFFTVSMLFFFSWLRNFQNKMLVLSGLALGLGFLTKYQMLIAGVIMIATIPLLAWNRLKLRFSRFALLIITALLVVTPWIALSYNIYASQMLDKWPYALEVGNPAKSVYSERFPLPIFYFVELTWPYSGIHPISLFIFILSLLGLGLFAWRRKNADKLLLTWFAVVFVFFTLIPNKHWRYVVPLFPVLAVSAASFIFFFYEKAASAWRGAVGWGRKHAVKIAAGLFTVFIATAMVFSAKDTYDLVAHYQIQIDVQGATTYACSCLSPNESIMLLCPFNLFNKDMVKFYLWADGTRKNQVYQYPDMPVDSYTPDFNITQFISLCKQENVTYVFTYEYGGTVPYYNTTLNLQQIYMQLYDSGNFTHITENATFGANPRRIFILTFAG
jgi:4-amino-4-deoxy-L-arabinose transferase-like glycosyltransferase